MTQRSRLWDGSTVGDATEAPYNAPTEFAAVLMSISGAGGVATHLSGIFRGELNELAATSGVNIVNVNTGRAIVWGTWYENDVSVGVAIPTPAGATRIDRIVARKDWLAQTVRLVRIAGAEGGATPAMTQVVGTTWDMPVVTVSITTGGVITLTDTRQILGGRLPATWTTGGLIYGTSTTALGNLPAGAVNSVLTSDGANPIWSATPTVNSLTVSAAPGITLGGAASIVFAAASTGFINFAAQTTSFIRAGTTSLTLQNSAGTGNLTVNENGTASIRSTWTIIGGGANITGAISITVGGQLIGNTTSGVSSAYFALTNTGGTNYIGVDSGAGTTLFNYSPAGVGYACGISASVALILRMSALGASGNVVIITTTNITISMATIFSAGVTFNAATTFAASITVSTGNLTLTSGSVTMGGTLLSLTANNASISLRSGSVETWRFGDGIGTSNGTLGWYDWSGAGAGGTPGVRMTLSQAGALNTAAGYLANTGNIVATTGNVVATAGALVVTTGTAGVIPLNLSPDSLGVHHIRLAGYTGLQATTGSAQMWLFSNAYFTGTVYKYITTFTASAISLANGAITLQVAASGTAGNNITWITPVTIQTTGRVDIGVVGGGARFIGLGSPSFVAGDKYLVITPATGDIHISALGPAS